jgi:Cu-Zn family superoxide dismutase
MSNPVFLLLLVCSLAGCGVLGAASTTPRAVARLSPTQGNAVTGTVTFFQTRGGVRVVAVVAGLTPGSHGFHLHQNGDCSAPDGSSAGGHFMASETTHGAPEQPAGQRHTGDLGNLEADASGTARYDRTDALLTFDGPNALVGRAVIVHASPDDYTTQPTGNAGARIACGVVAAGG